MLTKSLAVGAKPLPKEENLLGALRVVPDFDHRYKDGKKGAGKCRLRPCIDAFWSSDAILVCSKSAEKVSFLQCHVPVPPMHAEIAVARSCVATWPNPPVRDVLLRT